MPTPQNQSTTKPPDATSPASPLSPPATSDAIPVAHISPKCLSSPVRSLKPLEFSYSDNNHHYPPERAVEGAHSPPNARRNTQSTSPHGFVLHFATQHPTELMILPMMLVRALQSSSIELWSSLLRIYRRWPDIISSVKNKPVSEKMAVLKHLRHP